MVKLIYTMGVLCWVFVGIALARQYNVEEYLKVVEEKNPEIAYYRKQKESIKFQIDRFYLPQNPSIELERMYVGGDEEKSYYIKQVFENPFKLSKYRKKFVLDYDIARYEYEATKNKILTDVEMLYYDYIFILNKKKILLETINIINTVLAVSKNIPDNDSLDILKIELEYSMVLKELKEIETQENIFLTKLSSYSGDYDISFSTHIFEDIMFDYNKDEIFFKLKSNPDIMLSEKEWELAGVNLSIYKMSYIPDFTIGYRKRKNPSSYDIILGFDLPLFLNKNKSYINENQFKKEAYMENYKKKLIEKEYMLKEIFLNLENYYNLFRYYKGVLLTKSDAEFNLSLSSYRRGKVNIEDLMKSFKRYLEIKVGYYNYLTNFYKERARLKEIIGGKL